MTNPLLDLRFEIPFADIEPQHVEPAFHMLLREANERLNEIEQDKGPRTYESTLGALEAATEKLDLAARVTGHLESVATSPELREVWNRTKPKVSELFTNIPLREGLFRALKEFAETPEAKALSPVRARFLAKTLDEMKRHGAELPPDGKKRLAELDMELTKVTTKFSQNVLDATNAFEVIVEDEARLSGLPDAARAAAKLSAQEKGKSGYRFTLQAPSLTGVLMYADDATLRRDVWRGHNLRGTQAPYDNRENVARIIELRRAKANLLGFANFADLVLCDRMAKTGGKARDFIDDLTKRTRPFFDRENAELTAYRKELEGPSAKTLEPWDVAYYAEKQRKARYDFDDEELTAYFPAEHVMNGVFETAQRLYDVKIVADPAARAWDPSVRAYRLLDEQGGHLGSFFVDLYPRENKQDGAWMSGILTNVPPTPQLGLFCANITPPVGSAQALLRHREVETLFHEFGHLMHHLLSRAEVKSLGGTQVAWDFVELPSQLMENWCWERQALSFLSRHHQTGAPIPDALFDKMIRARTYRAANAQMRQLGFAAVDLAIHVDYDPKRDGDVLPYTRNLLAGYSAAELPSEYGLITSFSHLFSSPVGYAAGYYSYKWAEVLEADVFGRFLREGIFDRELGKQYRERILAKGDTEDPMDLFKSFMGREPALEPLLERQGLV